MTRIYTRSGDAGETGLANATRLPKKDCLFAAIGDIDELNAHVGMIRALQNIESIDQELAVIQHQLFDLGAQVAQYHERPITSRDITQLEHWIDDHQSKLAPIKQFILPAGNQAGTQTHLARSVCRRAERSLWQTRENHEIPAETMQYLNRLSDYLFVLSRVINTEDEVFWQPTTG